VRGATVVVRRGDGDWEWTSPAGVSESGETARELPLTLVPAAEWSLFSADAPHDAAVVLSDEHDRYEATA